MRVKCCVSLRVYVQVCEVCVCSEYAACTVNAMRVPCAGSPLVYFEVAFVSPPPSAAYAASVDLRLGAQARRLCRNGRITHPADRRAEVCRSGRSCCGSSGSSGSGGGAWRWCVVVVRGGGCDGGCGSSGACVLRAAHLCALRWLRERSATVTLRHRAALRRCKGCVGRGCPCWSPAAPSATLVAPRGPVRLRAAGACRAWVRPWGRPSPSFSRRARA